MHKLLILFGFLVLQACGQSKFQPIAEDGVILAFGDSLTEGVGVSSEDSYPSVLATLTKRKVINAGVRGEVTKDGLVRLEKLLNTHDVDFVILLEGGNDILRNQNISETKSNLAQMIQVTKRANIDMLLVGVPEKNLFSSVAPIYDQLAEEYDLAYERDLISKLLKQSKYKSDAVHFNKAGYQKMAVEIFERLEDLGAI